MVGQHIGKYRITEQIGRGGMGTVYLAVDETLHREVAVKVLNAELNDPTVARRFRAEAVTVARLNHPGIATIYELLQHDGQWLMVMEFLRGETLEAIVRKTGPLAVPRAAELVMQTLAALAHAHSLGVVHRDLKPANLMLAQNGMVKVMDFGIARVAGGEQLTSAGFMMGTPAYMAPEQVLGEEIDARTDLYSTGLVFYHLVTGQLPFGGTTPLAQAQARIDDVPTPVRTARPDVPAWIGQVIDIALARQPLQRFQTALLFREAIRRGLANLPIETPPPAVVPPELVATAAPSSLPVLTTPPAGAPSPVVKVDLPASPVPGVVPTPARASIAVSAESPMIAAAPAALAPGAQAHATRARARVPVAAVAAAALVVVSIVGVWLWTRSGATEPVVPTPVASNTTAPLASTVASTPPAAAVSPYAAAPAPAAGSPAGGASAVPAVVPPPVTSTGTLPATPGAATASAPAAGPAAPGDRATGASGTSARGRGAAADAPVAFKNARAFLVSGTEVDERAATLSFGGGRVTVSDENGQKRYGSMAYADISAAVHSRGKNPRWYPVLAGPPAGVDMPGGLFRPDRHWFAFQSRANYLLVRVDDDDYRRVIESINARLKVKVDALASRPQ